MGVRGALEGVQLEHVQEAFKRTRQCTRLRRRAFVQQMVRVSWPSACLAWAGRSARVMACVSTSGRAE